MKMETEGLCYTWNPKACALIVDVQGCTLKKDFFAKEMAFYNSLTGEYWVGTFQPPMDRSYLKKKYVKEIDTKVSGSLGLSWEEGAFPYQVGFTMLNYFGKEAQLYALGKNLCQWIQQYTSLCVVNLEELGCQDIPLQDPRTFNACPYHDQDLTKICALDRARQMALYLNELFSLKVNKDFN